MPKRKCSFNIELQNKFPFKRKTDFDVQCLHCDSTFSISHGGWSDISDHIKTVKHKKDVVARSSSNLITLFTMKKKGAGKEELKLAAAEGVHIYHTVVHNHSFQLTDCTSQLTKKNCMKKVLLCLNKDGLIVWSVLAPYVIEELQSDLDQANLISVSTDTSNHGHVKLVLVLVKYFKPADSVNMKIFDFASLPGETSEILSEHMLKFIQKHGLYMERLKEFCNFVDTQYQQLLGYSSTQWLALSPATERTQQIFPGLKSFFLSEPKCPVPLKNIFQDPCPVVWLQFTANQLILFNKTTLEIEKQNTSVMEVAAALRDLKSKPHAFKEEKFIGRKVAQLEEEGDIIASDFYEVAQFFQTALDYLKKWSVGFEFCAHFSWFLLNSFPQWKPVESSLKIVNEFVVDELDEGALFDEVTCVKKFVEDKQVESKW
uniref:Uncharacterized protein n=1 Tax=Latimeria chalumnae TaxID=7897 RepID=H3A4G4_LATCH